MDVPKIYSKNKLQSFKGIDLSKLENYHTLPKTVNQPEAIYVNANIMIAKVCECEVCFLLFQAEMAEGISIKFYILIAGFLE